MDREREIFQTKQNEVKNRLDKELGSGAKTFLVVSKNSVENQGYVQNYLIDKYYSDGIRLDFSRMNDFDILDENQSIEQLIKTEYDKNYEIAQDIPVTETVKPVEEKKVEKKAAKEKKPAKPKKKRRISIGFFDIVILLIGIACIAAAYLGYLVDLLEANTSFTDKQIFAINIALYALGGLWIFVFLVSLFDGGKAEKAEPTEEELREKVEEKLQDRIVPPVAELKEEPVVVKRQVRKHTKNKIVVTGLNSYIDKYPAEHRDRVTDRIRFEFAHIYSWLKNNDECELIVVWDKKVFISPDLTLLVFDTTIEIDEEFEGLERGLYFSERLLEEGILINNSHANKFANELSSYKDIDFLVEESVSVFNAISDNVDGIKLVFVQYIKHFEKEKYDLLSDHFQKKETPVRISKITINKKDFDLFSGNKIQAFDFADLELEPVLDNNYGSLQFPKLVEDKSFEFVNAKVEDDFSVLTQYINTLPDEELYKYCNLDIINYLIHEKQTVLVKKLMHSMVNVEFSDCADYVKYFYNGLVKNEKERGYQSSARALRYFYETIIDIEDGRDASYATGNADFYKENRNLIFKMIEYVHKNARKLEYVKLNDEHASEIIFRKD